MKMTTMLAAALVLSGSWMAGPLDATAAVNKSIRVGDGESASGQSTVNGSITVGNAAIVDGNLNTVNGSIKVGDDVRFESADTVNGSIVVGRGATATSIDSVNGKITLGDSASIRGSLEAVNGAIRVGPGSSVGNDVENVNGELNLQGTEVGGDLSTVSGDIIVTDGSIVRGDIVVRKSTGWSWGSNRRKPKVIIGPNSQVLGRIDAKREIELFISESATVASVTGEASLDDAVRFSGDRP